ncbi:ORF6N domain-containing protein [Escherichia coli]|uniref:ORF6N domain-containing protein n=1 Tax=Escherichia coli TaxID=562 RepID=A0A7D7KC92_ECOLX|nr:ORF6N domain-containing protein [Escherichia coli]EFJ8421579.1 ORF6N domain-containing protein [Escherichia coli]EJV7182091.1 ORF6N domain-containing protein [Escherichia coli]QMS36714.1 ORF6N domain-containing protein [Escherichia coli]
MTTQISVEALTPITHNQFPVITTELLAQLYGTEAIRIQQNHKRNSDRFVEGKHFFKIVGEELKNLRLSLRESQISPKTRSLILWTERGAARHAKMLETDQAWDVFEKLEDCYFSQKQVPAEQHQVIKGDNRTLVIRLDECGNIRFVEKVPDDVMVCTVETFKFWMEKNGWLVVDKTQLMERLMQL